MRGIMRSIARVASDQKTVRNPNSMSRRLTRNVEVLALLSLLIVGGIWIVSYWYLIAHSDSKTYILRVSGGMLRVTIVLDSAQSKGTRVPSGLTVSRRTGENHFWFRTLGSWKGGLYMVDIPLWSMCLVLLCSYLVARGRLRARGAKGRCTTCGYDLHGNVSGRCPECGTTFKKMCLSPVPEPVPPKNSVHAEALPMRRAIGELASASPSAVSGSERIERAE
jgi:hypothetical protein